MAAGWCFIVCTLVLLEIFLVDTLGQDIVRDGSLRDLALLLNNEKYRELFQHWTGSLNDTIAFLSLLEPWIVATPAAPLPDIDKQRDEVHVNCQAPVYESVFTGNRLPRDKIRMIVDFVPFGYDVDKLLLRLLETWDSVDVYVIYEMPFTLLGIYKPPLFPRIREQPRFKRFESKILYITGNADPHSSIGAMAEYVRNQSAAYNQKKAKERVRRRQLPRYSVGNVDPSFLPQNLHALMYKFDSDIIRYFKRLPSLELLREKGATDQFLVRSAILKESIMEALQKHGSGSVYGIQNDGDEIMTRKGLTHVKYCELRGDVASIYAPSFSFKNNFHWLQTTSDMKNWGKDIRPTSGLRKRNRRDVAPSWDLDGKTAWYTDRTRSTLNGFLWKSGPFLWPLQYFLDGNHGKGSVLRANFTSNEHSQHHLGYGAAFHMSAVSEPAEVWLKACGTVENVDVCWRSINPALIEAGKRGEITPAMVYESSIKPWCSHKHHTVHIDSAEVNPAVKAIIMRSIPRVIRDNPGYFPFMYPVPGQAYTGLFNPPSLPKWVEECQ